MPELPEVEVTRRRLESGLIGRRIKQAIARTAKLRLPVPADIDLILPGRTIRSIGRRGKYLYFDCEAGWLIIHLGMTGFLRVQPDTTPHGKHDHFELLLDNGSSLRLYDPRKFGTVVWTTENPLHHPLLSGLGPEPFSSYFTGELLFSLTRSRRVAIKQLIMDSSVLAGIGNIYANEALFRAGIRPDRPACSLTADECDRLTLQIRAVLSESIEKGSSFTLQPDKTAYHPLEPAVYGRGNAGCIQCGTFLQEIRLGNRSTVFCPHCQT